MMSTRPCSNCKKTVYVNEKVDAEGRWYHRPCFKCMAPNCNTSLTLRNFQMAALDDSVLDEMTGRPAKVLVCKEHVPMPKTSFGTDTLAFKHMTSAPKPSMPGLHRSLMGERGSATTTTTMMDQKHVGSPRSLAQGSHAEFLNTLKQAESNADGDEEGGKEDEERKDENKSKRHDDQQEDAKERAKEMEKEKESVKAKANEKGNEKATVSSSSSSSSATTTTTLPKYQRGRFTISDSDSMTVAHAAAEDAQDPSKDDDSFRNLPVRPEDYDHKEGHTAEDSDDAKNAQDTEDWDQGEEDEEDHKQQREFTMKGSGMSSAHRSNGGSSFMNKLQQSLDQQQQQQQPQHGKSEKSGKGGEIEVALESPVDISDRVQRDHLKIDLENDQEIQAAEIKAPPGEAEEKKLVDMAFSSKLMQEQQRNKKRNNKKRNSLKVVDKAVEDDEWGTEATSTTDSLGRREPVAGM